MAERVTTYICCLQPVAIETEGPNDRQAITVSASQVNAKIWPDAPGPGCIEAAGKITGEINATGEDPYCNIEEGELDWYRDFEDAVVDDFITVEVENPEHCHWDLSIVWFFTASTFRGIWQYCEPTTGGQPIPANQSKTLAFVPGGARCIFRGSLYANEVPGGRFVFNWRFSDRQTAVFTGNESPFFKLACITGGEVQAVIAGTPGEDDAVYTVQVETGPFKVAKASDLSIYAPGDWVFLMTPGGTECSTCGRAATKTPPESGDDFIIIPYRINSIGPS